MSFCSSRVHSKILRSCLHRNIVSTPFSTDRKQVSANGSSKKSTVCISKCLWPPRCSLLRSTFRHDRPQASVFLESSCWHWLAIIMHLFSPICECELPVLSFIFCVFLQFQRRNLDRLRTSGFYAMLYDLLTVRTIILSQKSNTLTYLHLYILNSKKSVMQMFNNQHAVEKWANQETSSDLRNESDLLRCYKYFLNCDSFELRLGSKNTTCSVTRNNGCLSRKNSF